MSTTHTLRRSFAPLALGLCIWLLWPAESLAQTLLRFVHAVPGVGRVTVRINAGHGSKSVGSIAFAQVSPWHSIRSGRFHWSLVKANKALAQGNATVGPGAYDMVLLAKSSGVTLGVYKARAGEPGMSLLRVIHAAPELGAPELKLDSKIVVSRLSFTRATPYLSVNPGAHSLAAMQAGNAAALVPETGVKLTADVAYSAIVVGTRGQRVRAIMVIDRGAPLTRRADLRKRVSSDASTSIGSSVTVHRGDSLWAIASRRLGPGASESAIHREVVAIWNTNAPRIGTGDPNLIFPGQRIVRPD